MSRFIVAVDQSTSASKVFLVDERGEIVRRASRAHRQSYPRPGYAEHDAEEIWRNTRDGIAEVCEGVDRPVALAISNQRETTVLWERATGKPVCPAIVWQDVRAEGLCREKRAFAPYVRETTGLSLSPYYSAAKTASVLRERPELRRRAERGELCVGTVDAFLVYRLTGGRVFRTDASNASRTAWMDLKTLQWDARLCEIFETPVACLGEIAPSDGDFGETACEGVPSGIPITGVLGDSHASFYGQGCVRAGMTKATFGTGSSVLMNVGSAPVFSQNGLTTEVGFAAGGSVCYALEGNVTCSGDTLCWLRDEAGMVADVGEIEAIAASVPSAEGVYLVPAFSGMGAPYYDETARAALIGMNRGTTRAHIVRAALESMAYQDADVLLAMARDTGRELSELHADGGATVNALLMQRLADLLGREVHCAVRSELSALGAAYLAGVKTGVYPSLAEIPARGEAGRRYRPRISESERKAAMDGWHDAVRRCLHG